MSKFEFQTFKLADEKTVSRDLEVSRQEGEVATVVEEYEFAPLKIEGKGNYRVIKAKFGPLAVTDSERTNRQQRDRRFSLNPLLKDSLSVEQEENNQLEQKVKIQIDLISQRATDAASKIGYEEGLKRGFEEAYARIRSESDESLKSFDRVIREMENAKDQIYLANEHFLIELVFRISRMVLLKDLSVDRDYVSRVAKELVGRMGARENIIIKINPDDAKIIDILKEGLDKAFGGLTNLQIEVSSQVKLGGCQVETEWNAIDASVELQLQGIYQSLGGKGLEKSSQEEIE